MTELEINRKLWSHFLTSDYKLFNTFIFGFESDFFCISKSGYVIECEIKISKSDFKADFRKNKYGKVRHEILQDRSKTFKPNRFYFAVPKGLLTVNDIPDYVGLIEVDFSVNNTKQAPFLHKVKLM